MKESIIKYMSNVFRPVFLVGTKEKLLSIKYENPLFTLKNYNGKLLYFSDDITISTRLYKFLVKYNNIQVIDIIEKNNKFLIKSNECIPVRFFKMIKDFHCSELEIIEGPIDYDKWRNIINNIPENVLSNIYENAISSSLCRKKLKVLLSPDYRNEEYKNSKNQNSEDEINKRDWETFDAGWSANVDIFVKKCKMYIIFKNNDDNDVRFNNPFNVLCSAQGGLDFRYYKYTHEYELYNNNYCDVKGKNSYMSNRYVPIEEIIIFSEALKNQGAEILLE